MSSNTTTTDRLDDLLTSPAQKIRTMLDTRLVTRGRVVQIGVGGVGRHLIFPLATFLAGQCGDDAGDEIELLIIDGDNYAPENTYRLDIATFGNKAEVTGHELIERFSRSSL